MADIYESIYYDIYSDVSISLELGGFTIGPSTTTIKLEIADFTISRSSGTYLEVVDFDVSSGIRFAIETDTVPEAGELLDLVFVGDPDNPTTWRVVSITGGFNVPTFSTVSNLISRLKMPINLEPCEIQVGARQGTGTEIFETLEVSPTPYRWHQSATSVIGAVMHYITD